MKAWHISTQAFTKHAVAFDRKSRETFNGLGFIVGRLLRLMHRNGQSWSSTDSSTNSHWGNVVVYRDDDGLYVNFADFDISCTRKDLTRIEMEAVQRNDVALLETSLCSESVGMRKMRGIPFRKRRKYYICDQVIRNSLKEGFRNGYASDAKEYSNRLDFSLFQDLAWQLRSRNKFSFAQNDLEGYLDYYPDVMAEVAKSVPECTHSPQEFVDKLLARIDDSLRKVREEA